MDKKKILIYVAVGFVLFWIIGDPIGAANTVNDGQNWLGDAAGSMQTFLAGVFQ
ncbi:hypothetical protein FHX42_005244 [Saccharopolyspora lacisalsi]|uniref:Uncharacterized protein n=1 Tax=Halosaccharopolyspora lacisalsi TaxID=1000566 RepID=A0A839E813_9PSEU|nr:hypothetical protein [Halosaccharopolyspora lacisalsi]MBA8827837.1 hypothetical protein [Halosaccharopolyspora lacisalsi]